MSPLIWNIRKLRPTNVNYWPNHAEGSSWSGHSFYWVRAWYSVFYISYDQRILMRTTYNIALILGVTWDRWKWDYYSPLTGESFSWDDWAGKAELASKTHDSVRGFSRITTLTQAFLFWYKWVNDYLNGLVPTTLQREICYNKRKLQLPEIAGHNG